jgi:hypothetical protein
MCGGLFLHELNHYHRYGHFAPFGLHAEVSIAESSDVLGVEGVAKIYRARLTRSRRLHRVAGILPQSSVPWCAIAPQSIQLRTSVSIYCNAVFSRFTRSSEILYCPYILGAGSLCDRLESPVGGGNGPNVISGTKQHGSSAIERNVQQGTVHAAIMPRNQETLPVCGPVDGLWEKRCSVWRSTTR